MTPGRISKGVVAALAVGLLVCAVLAVSRWVGTREPAQRLPDELWLSEAQVREAVAYGLAGKDDLLVDFLGPWTVAHHYGFGSGQATIYTPFLTLALFARNAALSGMETDPGNLARLAREECRELRFDLTLYGNKANFEQDFKIFLLDGEKELPPARRVGRGYDQAREYTIVTRIDLYFPCDVLRARRAITLRVADPEVRTLDFVFEPEKIR